MAKQTFTTGQVLSAAQVNALQANDYNTTVSTKTASYVLVANDVGTTIVQNVATANTVTVNTGLFAAGDTLRIQNIGAGIATVTAGTATVNTANSLALPQWGSGILYFTSASAAIFFPSAGAAAGGASKNFTLLNSGGTALTGAATVTISGISGKDSILVYVVAASAANGNAAIQLRLNGDTGSNYWQAGLVAQNPTTYTGTCSTSSNGYLTPTGDVGISLGELSSDAASVVTGAALFRGCNSSGVKVFNATGCGSRVSGTNNTGFVTNGFYNSATVISSVSVFSNYGSLDAGTVYVYTSA